MIAKEFGKKKKIFLVVSKGCEGKSIMKKVLVSSIILFFLLVTEICFAAILFEEKFEDADLVSRGWYDNTTLKLSTKEHLSGSTSSVEFHFLRGAKVPEQSGGSIRKKFAESDSIYISFYIKHSSNWVGSGKPYHPHEFYILTNIDGGDCGDYCGLSVSHLTTYIEENGGKPALEIQDVLNINQSKIGQDLTNITEQRAVAGCNGYSQDDDAGPEDCYRYGNIYRNDKTWRTDSAYFQDARGPNYKGDWHHIEAFFKLNSVMNGKGSADGILQYWYDNNLIMNHNNVLFRTGQHPSMKYNQFIIAPYIGDGSPVDQTIWIDDLTVATSRPTGTVLDNTKPSSLQNQSVQ
jgi:hypothetical protein